MNYEVIDGKQEPFEKMFAKVLQSLKEAEGHTQSALYRDVNSPTSYLIVSDWSDETAFNTFIGSERFRNVTNWGKERVLRARPLHTIYRDAAPVGGPG